MLGFQEDIRRKTNSLAHHNVATYRDKHNINAKGKPTAKPFVKTSLRIRPLLTSSSTTKNKKLTHTPITTPVTSIAD